MVRHLTLDQGIEGSNPSSPANLPITIRPSGGVRRQVAARLIYESDVSGLLPAIRVPTLIIHRADALGFRVEHGRYLAAHIPGA